MNVEYGLQLYKTIFNTLEEGIVLIDHQGGITLANHSAKQMLGGMTHPADEAELSRYWELVDEYNEPIPFDQHPARVCGRTGESFSHIVVGMSNALGKRVWLSFNAKRFPTSENGAGMVVTSFTDITQKRADDASLQIYAQQQAVWAGISQEAMLVDDADMLMENITSLMASVLGADMVGILELNLFTQIFSHRASFGMPTSFTYPHLSLDQNHQPTELHLYSYALHHRVSIFMNDIAHENRFIIPKELQDLGIKSAVCMSIYTSNEPYGVLCVFSKAINQFTLQDGYFIQSMSNWLASFIERQRVDEQLLEWNAMLEERVATRTAQLRTILDSTGEGIFYTEGHRVDYVNVALCKITGYEPEELIGQDVSKLLQAESDPQGIIAGIIEGLRPTGVWRGELRLRRSDQSVFDAGLTLALTGHNEAPLQTVGVLRDISSQKAMDEQRSRFIANASHELRTPLTNLTTRLYLMQRRPEDFGRHLAILFQVEKRLRTLVENLLDVSRFETGMFTLQLETINLAEVVAEVVLLQTQEAEKHFITLESIGLDQTVLTTLDAARISQVFTNLIVNAIHYTPTQGKITVHLLVVPAKSQQLAFAQVSIKDTGIGISPENLPHIFQPFYRVDSIVQGSGLGLSIAQEIVHAHGGEIIVDSIIGRGSTFTVRLPIVTV
ncbi:MAG: ATP-binding protein [Phototrophicaceae bacterium]